MQPDNQVYGNRKYVCLMEAFSRAYHVFFAALLIIKSINTQNKELVKFKNNTKLGDFTDLIMTSSETPSIYIPLSLLFDISIL